MLFFIMTTSAAAHLLGKIIMKSPFRMWRNPFQKMAGRAAPPLLTLPGPRAYDAVFLKTVKESP